MRTLRSAVALTLLGLLGLPGVIGTTSATAATAFNTRLTIDREPAAQLYGEVAGIAVLLEYGPDGTGLAGRSVVLQRRPAGAASFTNVSASTTNSQGIATWTVTVTRSTTYRAVFAGGTDGAGNTYAASTSSTTSIKALRKLRTTKLDQVRSSARFVYGGKVAPKYARKPIYLQRKSCSTCAWKTLGKQRTTRLSNWRFVVRAKPTTGAWRYRTLVRGNTQFAASVSGVSTIRTQAG